MPLDNYEGLKAEIVDWLARPDLVNKTETMISLFEGGVWPLFQGWEDTATANITTSAGVALISLPSAAKKIVAVRCADTLLVQAGQSEAVSEQGQPTAYIGEGETQVRLTPVPDGEYTLEVAYVGALPKLSSSVATNWLLDNFPQLYLYGALVHAKRYMQDVDYAEVDSAFAGQLDIVTKYINGKKMDKALNSWARSAV